MDGGCNVTFIAKVSHDSCAHRCNLESTDVQKKGFCHPYREVQAHHLLGCHLYQTIAHASSTKCIFKTTISSCMLKDTLSKIMLDLKYLQLSIAYLHKR